MYRQLAVLGNERRRQILDADARAAGHDHDVCVGCERVENRLTLVADETRELDHPAVALDERRQHRPVGVGNVEAVRPRSRRQQLVAGHDEPHARASHDTHLSMAHGAEDAEVLRPQHAAGLEEGRASHDVFATPADVLARRDRRRRGLTTVVLTTSAGFRRPYLGRFSRTFDIHEFCRQHRIGARRDRRARHHAHGFPAANGPSNGRPGIESPTTVSDRRL